MKKARLYGYVRDFLVDHDGIDGADILHINKYLAVKNNIKQNSDKLNKCLSHYWVLGIFNKKMYVFK